MSHSNSLNALGGEMKRWGGVTPVVDHTGDAGSSTGAAGAPLQGRHSHRLWLCAFLTVGWLWVLVCCHWPIIILAAKAVAAAAACCGPPPTQLWVEVPTVGCWVLVTCPVLNFI